MANLYELAAAGTEIDPAEQQRIAKEIQQRLDRERKLGSALVITGRGKGTGDIGGMMLSRAEKEAAGLTDYLTSQQKAKAEAARRATEDAWRRERAEEMDTWRRNVDERQRAAAAARAERDARDYQNRIEQQQLAEEARREGRTSQLAQRMQQSGLPGLEASMRTAEAYLADYPEGTDIPGIGGVSNVLPNVLQSDEANLVRSAVQGVSNQLLKLRSGAAVTDPEMRRFLTEVAMGYGVSEEVFRKRWPEVMNIIRAEKANLFSGFDPETVDAYMQRFESDAIQSLTGPSTQQPQQAQGDQWILNEDGSVTRVQ